MIEWGPNNKKDALEESLQRFTKDMDNLRKIDGLELEEIEKRVNSFFESSLYAMYHLYKVSLEQIEYLKSKVEEFMGLGRNQTSQDDQLIKDLDQGIKVLVSIAGRSLKVSESIQKLSAYFSEKSESVEDTYFQEYAWYVEVSKAIFEGVVVRVLKYIRMLSSDVRSIEEVLNKNGDPSEVTARLIGRLNDVSEEINDILRELNLNVNQIRQDHNNNEE